MVGIAQLAGGPIAGDPKSAGLREGHARGLGGSVPQGGGDPDLRLRGPHPFRAGMGSARPGRGRL